mmetsp:Transcript_33633/g.94604  ORF Transcript_33633/g.94604 Transcript_33633/m.94604 type:complete len:285 (+) Transcript_33633:844-1698(+)
MEMNFQALGGIYSTPEMNRQVRGTRPCMAGSSGIPRVTCHTAGRWRTCPCLTFRNRCGTNGRPHSTPPVAQGLHRGTTLLLIPYRGPVGIEKPTARRTVTLPAINVKVRDTQSWNTSGPARPRGRCSPMRHLMNRGPLPGILRGGTDGAAVSGRIRWNPIGTGSAPKRWRIRHGGAQADPSITARWDGRDGVRHAGMDQASPRSPAARRHGWEKAKVAKWRQLPRVERAAGTLTLMNVLPLSKTHCSGAPTTPIWGRRRTVESTRVLKNRSTASLTLQDDPRPR